MYSEDQPGIYPEKLYSSYKSDTIIIEPTGIAFPGQIKRNIENIGLPGTTFVPRVNLVDAGRLDPAA
ncbi:MAG: hypothetical protein NHB15_08015 [Methanosarcina barkeri]|nr:hypothetical protein [Methanosarcina sp. ERenArc_MAG2]